MSRKMTQPSRRPRRRSPRIGSRGINRPMPVRPPAAVRRGSISADGERGIHPTQVVAFQVAVQHVVAWRQVQGQGLAVVDVKAPDVVDSVDALGLIVDRQPVALQRQLAWVMVGSYDVDL